MNKSWTVQAMLEAWGLRVCGVSLKNPLALSAGGSSGADYEWQAMRYVESVTGFDMARPVLSWVYSHGLPVERYQLCRPGESKAQALKRLGWQDYVMVPAPKIPEAVLSDFWVEMEDALADRPFVPYEMPEAETVERIVQTAGQKVA